MGLITSRTDLSNRTLIRVSGEDANAFLQGQLTQDMGVLGSSHVAWAAHCSPKGRMLASFLMWREDGAFWLDAPEDMAEPALRRLRLYVLRSRVTLEDARGHRHRIGLCGPDLEQAMLSAGFPPLPPPGQHDRQAEVTRVVVSQQRLLLLTPPGEAAGLEARLAPHTRPGTARDWSQAAVQEGIAEIDSRQQDEWVPQMLNWDLVGGVSFKKGCYTGQEIVARTHYLGKIKRRLLRFRTGGNPEPGAEIHGSGAPGNAVGKVVMTGEALAQGTELLAVVQLDALTGSGALHLGSAAGPPLEPLALPYTVPLA